MRRAIHLILLSVGTIAVIYVSHHFDWALARWWRLTIAFPIIYAGYYYRRFSAFAAATLLIVAEGPLFAMQFGNKFSLGVEYVLVSMLVCILSVMYSNILRKGMANAEALRQTGELIRSMQKMMDVDSLYGTLERMFAEIGMSGEVSTYLFGEDGLLRERGAGDVEGLPEGHLFYAVAGSGKFMISSNPAQDSRLTFYGPEGERGGVENLAVFPVEYGGRVRGVVSIANSDDENFEKDKIAHLTAIKQAVENALDLEEKLRARISHEVRRENIRDTFSSYLSRTVAEEILNNPGRLELGGEVRDVTILFTEVTNFGELLGAARPEEILVRLNEFFSVAIDIIFEFDGTLDKFIGDNIMAFWGAPIEIPDGERRAVECARKLHVALEGLNRRWEEEGAAPFRVCIGINSGPVVAGNIGSIRRMEYTVIGDTVNVASRIKSLSGSRGAPILMGEATYEKIRGSVDVGEKMEATLKGKSGAITVYQVAV